MVKCVRVIPLKLFYHQLLLKLGIINIRDINIKKCNKKMGSPCLFTRQQVLKMGYFYWLRVKNSNHLHTEFSLGNLKDTKFYFEIKASFIKINSIASCYLFLIAWLWGFCTFSDSSVVSLKSSPLSKYAKYGTIFKKNHVLLSTFFPIQICSLLECS